MPAGLVLVDKPQGITSHDVVARLRKKLGTKKIGHAGTLDPMATGLLVLGVDAGTKLLTFLVGADKTYKARIRLGQSTVTDDAEGEVLAETNALHLNRAVILSEIAKLTGRISQTPSSVSAIKVAGKRAYDLVREGQEVVLKAREVEVSRFELTSDIDIRGEFLEFDVVVDCSSGTYIRALARDLGASLGVGAHLRALRRTKVGEYLVEHASNLDAEPEVLDLTIAASKLFPVVALSEQQAVDLVHGKRIQLDSHVVVAATYQGRLIGILEPAGSSYKSLVVFPEVLNG
ncbi:MAG: tRNA pseudouridine(55) synthase TruB [Actinobacteria bacterium]|nr:tRNA pseudouridine(55) synthase TruB [Actinomycetota bacterium]